MDLLELMMELDIYLFGSEKHDAIYNRIIYLRSLKTIITYVFSHYYAKIKVDSYDSLAIERRFTLHNTIILIKSTINKGKNHYYYKTFLEILVSISQKIITKVFFIA